MHKHTRIAYTTIANDCCTRLRFVYLFGQAAARVSVDIVEARCMGTPSFYDFNGFTVSSSDIRVLM